jgi:hypothetical protein
MIGKGFLHVIFVYAYVMHVMFVYAYVMHVMFVYAYVMHVMFVYTYMMHVMFVYTYVKKHFRFYIIFKESLFHVPTLFVMICSVPVVISVVTCLTLFM